MLEVKRLVPPSPEHFLTVIEGMRGAFKSYDKSDSGICTKTEFKELCYGHCSNVGGVDIDYLDNGESYYAPYCLQEVPNDVPSVFVLGHNDGRLLMGLTKLGTSDRKLLRQLPIILEIKAPLYWHKQMDRYQVGTTFTSESTMHTITKYPFTIDDFSLDHAGDVDEPEGLGSFLNLFESFYLKNLNYLRDKYLETGEEKYEKLLIELLPESYNQRRTISMNYEVALQIISQRKGHKLGEWEVLIDYLLKNVPYLDDIYKASCYKDNKIKKLEADKKELQEEIEKRNKRCVELEIEIEKLEDEIMYGNDE